MQQEGNTLTDFLSDEPTAEAVTEAVAAETPEPDAQAEGQPRGPDGKFASKQPETGVDDTAPPADKLPQEDYKAIREEREKRQNLERELETLRQTVQQLQQPKEPPAPPPTIWDDEQGWQQHFGSQVVQQASLNATLQMSEMLTRREHRDDFDQMKARFLEMAEQNPAIVQQALSDPDPWAKAYAIAKNAATMAELGAVDMADLEAKIEARLREEMQGQQSPVPQPTVPLSLTGERNVGARSGPAWTGPSTLADFLR